MQIGAPATVRKITDAAPAVIATAPDDAWCATFAGEGFDPADAAHRIKALGRAVGSVYVSVREADATLAVGVGAFGFGWASIHGMRTDQRHRGRGLARRVLAGIADAVMARKFDRIFLQVEEANHAARALYRRAGFEPAWRYFYWRRRSG